MPGVSQASLGDAMNNGTDHPFIEYRAAEGARWEQPTRFNLQQSSDARFSFMAILPGAAASGSNVDAHITNAIVKKWETQCGVEANVLFE